MSAFRKHYSKQDLIQLAVFCAFPIHIWAIVNMFHDIPAMLLYMTGDEIIGSMAYNMSFALVETTFIFLVVIAFGLLLPSSWTRSNFIPITAYILTELTLMITVLQILGIRPYSRVLLGLICLLILVLTAMVVPKYPQLSEITRAISTRLTVLTIVYVLIDLVGVMIVISRNV